MCSLPDTLIITSPTVSCAFRGAFLLGSHSTVPTCLLVVKYSVIGRHYHDRLLKICSMCSRLFLYVVSRYCSFFPRFSTSDFRSEVSLVKRLSTSFVGLNTNLFLKISTVSRDMSRGLHELVSDHKSRPNCAQVTTENYLHLPNTFINICIG